MRLIRIKAVARGKPNLIRPTQRQPHRCGSGGMEYIMKILLAVDGSEMSTRALVVMGSHGRSANKGLLMGSVGGKVIAICDAPVTMVR